MWLVEARAVRIGNSPWAPLFEAVVKPNTFTATVEQSKQAEPRLQSLDEFWQQFESTECREAAAIVVEAWQGEGRRRRLGPNHVVLEAKGPSKNGWRTVAALYSDGRVLVPFSAYEGTNSGIPIDALTTDAFRARANTLFGFDGSERHARTAPDWLTSANAEPLLAFCTLVADEYSAVLNDASVAAP